MARLGQTSLRPGLTPAGAGSARPEPGPGRGQVVDFFQLPHFPIFNIADSAIVTAAVLIALLAFRGIGIDGVRAKQSAGATHDA